uniref:Putative myosin-3 n=1 Tax=Davidia involucrata TaxID=16924 RepID=A0A5B7C0I2_DAVIN
MFKSARWRREKKKIKAVFKLQFQATQVPQLRGTTMMISLVPADVGKPTVRLEKAPVLDGTCSWENPIYETVKLIRELKTGIFSDKIYYFIMSTGSSKSGILGEVSLNLADYIEATKPLTVSLPLRTSDSAAILHVTLQNIQGGVDQRDVEESEAPMAKLQDRNLKNQMRNCNRDGSGNPNFAEDEHFNNFTSQNAELNGSFRDLETENSTIPQDHTTLRRNPMPPQRTINTIPTENHVHRRSITDWSLGSASDGSMADSTNSPEENLPRDRLEEASNTSIERLKSEISMLERQVEVSELELQSLRKQIVKESRRGQDQSRQIVSLKEERDTLKTECEWLKSSQQNVDEAEVSNQLQMESESLRILLDEVRQELNHEKDLNTTLRLQLEKTEDSNAELILAVRDLDEMLEQKNREMSLLSSIAKHSQNVSKCDHDAKEVDLLKQKVTDLSGEIEVYMKEREELKMHMKQLGLDYEILKQENHDISSKLEQNQIEQMKMQNECSEFLATIKEFKKDIQKQALELSESSDTINKLETQVKSLEKELEKQAQGFEDDLEAMGCAKVEQEQRAIRAEEALRKTRWNNANAAERLQEEFRRLSVEMASKLDENEKLAMKAVTEANDLRLQKRVLEEMLQKANEELGLIKDQYEVKLQELSNKTDLKAKQIEQMSLELHEKSMKVENFKVHEEEMHEAFSSEIQTLKGDIEGLKMEKNCFFEEAEQKEILRGETEQMKTSIGEQEMLQRRSKEREDLEREFASVRKEAEELQEESNTLRSLEDKNETIVGTLQSEVQKLKVQYNDLKNSMFEVDLEKENLRKQVFKLEGDLQKKEEAITSLKQATHSDVKQMTSRDNKTGLFPCDYAMEVVFLKEKLNLLKEQIEPKEAALENSTISLVKDKDLRIKIEEMQTSLEQLDHSRSFSAEQFQQEVGLPEEVTANTRELERTRSRGENVQLLEKSTTVGKAPLESELRTCSEKETIVSPFHTNDDLTELLSEVALLKKRNKHMEGELKEMQERYSEISLKFAEVEGERQQLVMTVRNLKNGKKN